jgi:hypothetical protein
VLRALGLAVGRGEDQVDAWETFLLAPARKTDRLRLVCAIATRLARLPQPLFQRLIDPVTEWMLRVADRLQSDLPNIFALMWERGLATILANPESVDSAALDTKGYDWATHALNAPAGKLAQALLKDPGAGSNGLPDGWLDRAKALLNLGGPARRDSLVFFARQVPYLRHHAPAWTDEHVLSVLGADHEDEQAFWSGFFWAAQFPGYAIFRRLKPYLLAMAVDPTNRAGRLEIAAGLVLGGWANVDEETGRAPVSDSDLRDALRASDYAFRHQIIWQLRGWSRGDGGEWRSNALRLLREVWPRELVVRSPKVSEDLFSLVLETGDDFPAFVGAVTPLMTALDKNANCMLELTLADGKADALDPKALLTLVHTALPENAADWPWRADVVVDRVARTAETARDPRAAQLRQRLARR